MRARYQLPALVIALLLLVLDGQAALRARQSSLDWQTFEVPGFGTRVEYPARIFAQSGETKRGTGQRFESADGRATLTIYATENEAGDTPGTYLRKYLRQSRLGYERITRAFFAISKEGGGLVYYSRCNFSRSAKAAIHCFDLVYPQQEKRAWDPVVTRISLSLRPLER
jgi:hypothetical protein